MATEQPVSVLLDALKPEDVAALRPQFESVILTVGQRLSLPGRRIAHAYFPTSGMISLVCHYGNGAAIEVGLIGREGFWGGPLIMGASSVPFEAIVQSDGRALRVSAKVLIAALDRSPELTRQLLRYSHFLQIQVALGAGCNGLHTIQRRLARRLLEANDRLGETRMMIKHESLSYMLGVRRAGITSALAELKAGGIIEMGRGRINILNRSALETESCECYRIAKKEYRRLFV